MSWQPWLIIAAAVLLTVVRRRIAARRRAVPTGNRRLGRRSTVLLLVAGILGVQSIVGLPAFADQCGQAPLPETPNDGMVAAIDPPNGAGSGHGTMPGAGDKPTDAKFNYYEYDYAGTTWHVYENNCGPAGIITNTNAVIDTWAGNELFNIGKNIVGATNSLHYAMLSPNGMFASIDNAIGNAAKTFYNNIYVRWFAPVALLLALLLFRQIWKGDLAGISRRGMWALAGMWLAASVTVLGPVYQEVDSLLLQKTADIQAGFVSSDQADAHNALPESLYNNVIYTNWLRGEFGNPISPQAQQYGQELLNDQAISRDDEDNVANLSQIDSAKQNDYLSMPAKLGPAAGYFEGAEGSRTGDGFLALFQAIAFSLFQLFAKAAIVLAQVLIRVLMLAGPLIGLAAMLLQDLLPRIGRAAGAILFNVLMLSALAGMHALLLSLIFNAGLHGQLSLLAQILLATLITVVFFMIGKPVRRMWQMFELSVSAAGLGMSSSSSSGLMSLLRRRKNKEPTPQEQFWENVREGDDTDAEVNRADGRRRVRPEAHHADGGGTVLATAQRMDRRYGRGRELPGTPGSSPAYALPGGPRGYAGPSAAVPESGSSRLVDTPPVVDAAWDRGEDAFVVPSRVSRDRQGVPSPRKAEMEMVAGRPVFVLYRPSRGLEVRDADWDQTGRTTTR